MSEKRTDMHPEAESEEIQKLQYALEQTLREVQQLRSENAELNRKLGKLSELQSKRTEEAVMQRIRKLDYQNKTAHYRLEKVQNKYNDLANSRLGRLTLNYWAWQSKNKGSGKIYTFFSFVTRWLFNRLPVMNVIDLEEDEYRLVPETDQAEKPKIALEEKIQVMTPEMEHWIDGYMDRIAAIPDSNGCRYYDKMPYRIGLVCDEFFYESISAAADFVFLTPQNWQAELEQGLDAFLFVSAWRGLHEEWRGLGAVNAMDSNPKRKLALELLDICREKQIPTIFYSKEDPPNYEVFLEYAKHCDYAFTTAKECVPYYEEALGGKRVAAVSFGINPIVHNPIGFHTDGKEDTVLFSGSWMIKYPDRCKELAAIFDGVLKAGHKLHIIDRNYPGVSKYHFPEPYFSYASPALPHDLLQKLHKLFDWAVNINSVKASETMFANRAFELQANGVLLLSNFSVGVNNMLPTVQMVQDNAEVAAIMKSLSGEELYERQIAGIRSVMTGHTCFDRLAQLLAPTCLHTEQPVRRILVLTDRLTDAVRDCFAKQTYGKKTLMPVSDVTARTLDHYDMVTWFAPDGDYGVFYLEDMINAFKYTACDYVTKDAWMDGDVLHEGVEHNYVITMGSKYRTVFWRKAYDAEFLLSLSGPMKLDNGYSIDHFHYNAARAHSNAKRRYQISVIIPVCGNGGHLYAKSFSSLRRSSMFRDMEILLVKGKHTDEYTRKMICDLQDRYANVRVCSVMCEDEAFASMARYEGAKRATARYVTFLNADSEAVSDGYAKLYAAAKGGKYDLVMGNSYACGFTPEVVNVYRDLTRAMRTHFQKNGLVIAAQKAGVRESDLQGILIRRELARGKGGCTASILFENVTKPKFEDIPVFQIYGTTAPLSDKRPMPTLDDLRGSGKRTAAMPVAYSQNGTVFTFRNQSDHSGSAYAWVVLVAGEAYQKVHSSRYTADPEFTYDFSVHEPGIYKVRAFVKTENGKNSNDVAVIRLDELGNATLIESLEKKGTGINGYQRDRTF